jgi:hypothetical protein
MVLCNIVIFTVHRQHIQWLIDVTDRTMLDSLPPIVINTLDKILGWIYSFQPILEPTVVLGKYVV